MSTNSLQNKEETPAPRHDRYGEFTAILSCLVAIPLNTPAVAVLAPILILAVMALINRLKGRPFKGIPFACRRLILYALIFVAVCFCAQLAFAIIPGMLVNHGLPVKYLLVSLGWANMAAQLITACGLIIATIHACTLLKKAAD